MLPFINFRLAHRVGIEKDVDGERKVYDFVRADRMSSREDAETLALAQAPQIIYEQGTTLFQQSWPKTS